MLGGIDDIVGGVAMVAIVAGSSSATAVKDNSGSGRVQPVGIAGFSDKTPPKRPATVPRCTTCVRF
eukprot:m.532878 g.532878  ORF g.532878 m.532878 type:complete len:66 (+) comp216244_c0_seq1:170-367(+)